MPFEHNIYINCPFTKDYKPILRALVFGCIYLGYHPLIAENKNSAEYQLSRVKKLISQAKYSLHDLSIMQSSEKNELARFNMPFELGVDMGCKTFGGKKMKVKRLLILDKERYRYQRALSNIAGNNIETHKNDPEIALRKLRNWIVNFKSAKIDSAYRIWRLYNEFNGDFYELLKKEEWSKKGIEEMPWDEYFYYIQSWLEGRLNYSPTN